MNANATPTETKMTKKLYGPNGIYIVLDAQEIFPDDPGAGAPAMVYKGKHSATYWCALGEGFLGEGDYQMSEREYTWLEEQEFTVYEFIRKYSPAGA